jgi:RNA polymerase sigma factor (sigma-70 family)
MGVPLARHLQQVGDPPIAQHLDSIERERRTSAIADEALATSIVVGREAHGAMDVEPVARRREAPFTPLEICVRVVFGRKRSREERAARERELRAPVNRFELGGLVAELLGGALVEVAATAQPAHGAVAHALGDLGNVLLRRRRCLVKAHAAGLHLLEDAVDGDGVQVRRFARESRSDVVARETHAEAEYLGRELGARIQRALDDLPPRLREPCRRRFLDDAPYELIAEELGLTNETVRKRIQDARDILYERLGPYLRGGGATRPEPGRAAARRAAQAPPRGAPPEGRRGRRRATP